MTAATRPPGTDRGDWYHKPQEVRRALGRPRLDGLRAWYEMSELAELLGTTVRKLEGWLPADLIEQRRGPRTKRRVYISRLREREPEAYESMREALHARALAARAEAA